MLTFLTSRENGFVTIYDISTNGGITLSSANPTTLPSVAGGDFKRAGWDLIPQQGDFLALAELNEQGGLFHSMIALDGRAEATNGPHLVIPQWSTAVKALNQRGTQEELGPLAGRTTTVTDLSRLYQSMFALPLESRLHLINDRHYSTTGVHSGFKQFRRILRWHTRILGDPSRRRRHSNDVSLEPLSDCPH